MDTGAAAPAFPEYGRYYYENYEGTPYGRNPAWIARMGQIADHVVGTLKPASALDAGCAMGILVEALRDRGVDASGVDISEFAIAQIPEPVAAYCRQGSLAEPLGERYDLVITIEVLEHIAEVDLQKAIDNLCDSTDRILFSSTPYHYEDPTHINIKQPEQWSIEFARRGFFRDVNYDASYIEPWSALYVRRPLDLEAVVEQYDRAHWYQTREISRTRSGIIELQASLARLEQAFPGRAGTVDPIDAAIQANVKAEQDLLTLRDELLGSRSEVGEARGRVAEVEAELAAMQSLRLAHEQLTEQLAIRTAQLDAVTRSTSWRLMQRALAPYRRIRGISG